MLNPPINIVTI